MSTSNAAFQMANTILSNRHNVIMSIVEERVGQLGRPLVEAEVREILRDEGVLDEEAISIWIAEEGEENPDLVDPS